MKNTAKKKRFAVFFPFIFLVFISGASQYHAAEISLIPCGRAVGIKIYTDGLIVTKTGAVTDENGISSYPARKSSLKAGDVIVSANGTELKSSEQLSEIISENPGEICLSVRRDGEMFETSAQPVTAKDGTLRLGLWVRDSTAGIGTITYINPADNSFAALGHGICDTDTGNIMSVKSGNILNCSGLSVIKSKKGAPGELSGSFGSENTGSITKNISCGIFGQINGTYSFSDAVPAAQPSQVEKGDAYIMSDIDGDGVKNYSIRINKVSEDLGDKSIVFEITDAELMEKAGGIVQGMSGAPIIQNNKLIGAVTHVFVNNPQKGYGIFIENMLENLKKD